MGMLIAVDGTVGIDEMDGEACSARVEDFLADAHPDRAVRLGDVDQLVDGSEQLGPLP